LGGDAGKVAAARHLKDSKRAYSIKADRRFEFLSRALRVLPMKKQVAIV
jgi:hypothetical protein